MSGDTLTGSSRPDFVAVPTWLMERTDLSHGAFRLWVVLKGYLNAGQTVAWPRRQVLAERMGLRKADSVDRFLQELQAANLLTISARWTEPESGAGVRRRSSQYTLRTDRPPYAGSHSPDMGVTGTPDMGGAEVEPVEVKPEAPMAPQSSEHQQAEDADAALLPAAEDVVIQAWTSRLQAIGAGAGRALTSQQRAALRKHLRAGVTPERMVQVLGWAFTDPQGAFWRPKLSTWGAVLKHWATMHLQCPGDWREQVPLDLWHQQQDAAAAADRAVRAAAARQVYGLTQEAWDALPEDDRTDLLAVAAAPSEPDWEPPHAEAPTTAPWEEQRRALTLDGWG